MKFSLFISGVFLLFCVQSSFSQIQTTKSDTTYWEKKNTIGFDLSQISFVNWSAGGNNSISGLIKGNFSRKFEKGATKWTSELIIRYGINKQDGVEIRKTDDNFQFNSTIGHKSNLESNWFYTSKFNFRTQFTNGYAYPNTDLAVSKPFAPAYTFLGVGAEYADKERNFNIYLSPLTFKSTLVLDERLANQGAFGVKKATYDLDGNLLTKGEQSKLEMGFLITGQHKMEVMKNMNLENRLSLYSDYINRFGNIDVDWQATLDLEVNKYVRANVFLNLIYDDDIKTKKTVDGEQVEIGPKIQLKQIIGVGLVYEF